MQNQGVAAPGVVHSLLKTVYIIEPGMVAYDSYAENQPNACGKLPGTVEELDFIECFVIIITNVARNDTENR
jgi:hypothetical protein